MSAVVEPIDAFRTRLRSWVAANLRSSQDSDDVGILRDLRSDEEELAAVERDREMQRAMFDAGFAGLCVPREYGGQGLPREYQVVLNEELEGHEYPSRLQAPTFSPCLAVLLEFGTEAQKLAHIPAILKGEEIWMQLLSEPSGGSDVASAQTTAVRDGDEWVLNGSKVWTTGAWWSDWGLCLARTNWDVPKHRGLSVFIFPLHQPSIEVHRIEMLNGSKEFCQEFLSDLRVPDSDRVGDVNDGWTVGIRWMFHERMLHSSPLITVPAGLSHSGGRAPYLLEVARDAGRLDDPVARDLIGEARMLEVVRGQLGLRIGQGMATQTMSDQSAAVVRLFTGVSGTRITTIQHEIAGTSGLFWEHGDEGAAAHCGNDYLMRQISQIGGGTTEMARNVVSERVLGMPRERTQDRDVAFREVPRSPSPRS
jgi:alkylation response protein AidB-like acyl-CoA dehydrogenase